MKGNKTMKPSKKPTKKPSRKCNFNRFKTVDDAIAAFTTEVETLRLSPSAVLFAEWLWSPVAKGAK